MTTFQEREQAFEAKFAHDAEFRYLVIARRDKLFARWAAERARLSPDKADALVAGALAVTDGPGHDDAMIHFIAEFLGHQGRGLQHHELFAALEKFGREARTQLLALPPGHPEAP